ncbi:MFS transporter [Bacillus wiedmannii]|uniref:MFS transporter n=1 Tax=Bacillus wiedmannii TaxID=1890302 RepID=UPI000BF67657|nr:MFS transporter [Bacillus wiedmannii]MEE3946700.1 MFS transporter [Bacillus wiedmannii]PFZ87209.1 MFS transporter [Bacillus wiedmannii]
MQVSMGDGGSGGEEVLVNFQELLDIVMKLEDIYIIHLDVIGTNIESLLSSDFYQKGEAMRVIEKYPDILHKTLELSEHYLRSAKVVGNVCVEMLEKDEQLRERLSKL